MLDLSTLYRLGSGKTRSISPENPTGAPGKGGMCPLEQGSAQRAARDLGHRLEGQSLHRHAGAVNGRNRRH